MSESIMKETRVMPAVFDFAVSAKQLAQAAQVLSERGEDASAFAAAALSRLATAQYVISDQPLLPFSIDSLRMPGDFSNYRESLDQFTVELSRLFISDDLRARFRSEVAPIALSVRPTDLSTRICVPSLGSSEVYRKLSLKLAGDGMSHEAGHSLERLAATAWIDTHTEAFPDKWQPLVSSVAHQLLAATHIPWGEGHTAVWEQLQKVRFVAEPTPTALMMIS